MTFRIQAGYVFAKALLVNIFFPVDNSNLLIGLSKKMSVRVYCFYVRVNDGIIRVNLMFNILTIKNLSVIFKSAESCGIRDSRRLRFSFPQAGTVPTDPPKGMPEGENETEDS